MKKQLRIFLFAALLVLLLGVTVLAVSAAGEWRLYANQTAADADTENTAGTPYDTVAAAVSDIDTNGMVVKLTANLSLTENDATFSNTNTYTIDGDGHSIAYANTGSTRYPFWKITAGNVTIKDLTLNRTGYSNSHITFSGTPTVVLENLVLTGADNCFGEIRTAVNLTIQGAGTSFTDIDSYIAKLGNGSQLGGLVTIKDGYFCIGSISKGNAGKRIGFMCDGGKIKVEGGTFDIGSIAYTYASWTVDEVNKSSTTNGFFNFGDNAWSSPVEITGGTFNLSGSGWLFDVPGSEKWNGLGNCDATYDMGNDMIRISDGTFNMTGTSGIVRWRANYGTFARRDGSAITSPNQPTVSITGGTFKSQTVTSGFFRIESTQESNRCVINLAGGTFAGGPRWVYIASYGTVNFCGADFTSDYPGGSTVDPGENGFICSTNPGRFGSINFSGGSITNNKTGESSYLVRGSGVPITVSGSVTITTSSAFVRHLDNAYNSPVLITGGTFNLADNGYVLYAYRDTGSTYGQTYNGAGLGEDIIRITGGTFNVTGASAKIFRTRVNYAMASKADGAVTSGHPNLTITGGTFNITANADAFSDNSTVASSGAPIINISGGTFTDSGTGDLFYTNQASNAIITITGTTASFTKTGSGGNIFNTGEATSSNTYQPVFNIKGGTFNGGANAMWIQAKDSSIYNLGDPDDLSSTYPRFTGSVNWAIALKNKSAGYYRTGTTGGQVHIYSGIYTYTATNDKAMIDGSGAAVYIAGGTFSSTSDAIFFASDRDVISPLHITGGDFTVTKSGAAILWVNYHNGDSGVDGYAQGYRADKDVCGQVRAVSWTYGNTVLKIDGGNFHVNASGGNAVRTHVNAAAHQATAWTNYPDGLLDRDDTLYVEITGGTFTTSTNNIDAFIRDGRSGVNARYTTAENGVNPTLNVTYNISGTASFTGGCAWILLRDNGVFNISGGTFHSGATASGDTRYLWIQNPSVAGGQMNISGGTFTATTNYRLINAAGADLTITGGTFTAKTNLINMSDGDMPSNVTITGGTFRSTGEDSTILFNAGDSSQNWHEGTVRITGGTFLVDNAGTASVRYSSAQTHTNYFYIEGGTFDGAISTTVSAAGHKLLITGGRFKAGSGYEAYVPGRGYVGVTDDSTYKRVTAANLHGFAGSQMRLGTDLGVYFYVLTQNAVDTGTPSLVVSYEDDTLATLTGYTTPANYPDGTAVESGYTLYCFTFNGLPPQRLGDDLDVVFKLTDVAKFGNEFSGLRYCRQVRAANPEDGDLLAITGALLNFGAAAQAYSGYHYLTPVNATAADITGAGTFSAVGEKLASYGGTLGTPHFVKTEENGVAARGVRFDTGIQLYARVIDTTGEVTCTYSVAGGSPVACEKVDLGSNRYAFYTGAITLDHFESNVVFTLSTGETCTYSVQAFVYYYQDMDAKASEQALAQALWAYKTAVVGAAFNEWAGFDVADVVNP